jgi:putative transposase
MSDLESFISNSDIVREVERAVAVKTVEEGLKPLTACKVLKISDASVSKRKIVCKNKGAEGLRSGYKGSKGYLSKSQKAEIIKYLEKQEHPSVEESRDYIEKNCGILYESEQSYCDLPNVRWVKPAQK